MKKYVLDVIAIFLGIIWLFFAIGGITLAFETDFGLDLAFWFEHAFGVSNRDFINFAQISLIIITAILALILTSNDDREIRRAIRLSKRK
ncbi:TPA: hypothetical protein GXZ54_02815 [bacterium]|jgi:hypothetical protein|nr:hypothetical protein [bacterium]